MNAPMATGLTPFSGMPGIISITQGALDTCIGYQPWARGPAA